MIATARRRLPAGDSAAQNSAYPPAPPGPFLSIVLVTFGDVVMWRFGDLHQWRRFTL